MAIPCDLRSRLGTAAFAFRGYNVTNLGRTPELLLHPVYGPVMAAFLGNASQLFADTLKRPLNLVDRMREGRESQGLADYTEDVALIVAVELAQIQMLREFHGVELCEARLSFGYSLGECAAVISAGIYEWQDLLPIPLSMADDCVELAHEVTLAVLFSRGPVLDFDVVRRLCLEITQQGKGIIDVATYLSPNSLLLMGQNGTLAHFESLVHEHFPVQVYIRRQNHRWSPLHTPIMWQRNIPNRSAVMLQTTPGGFKAPALPLLSGVTGDASYAEHNSRELLHRWVDHPQRLWDMLYKVLAGGIQTVIHVGPAPNLLPATFKRLSNNVSAQMNGYGLGSIGRRTLSRLVRRPWLTRLLPSSTVLLRAPFVEHVVLEDWLLAQPPR